MLDNVKPIKQDLRARRIFSYQLGVSRPGVLTTPRPARNFINLRAIDFNYTLRRAVVIIRELTDLPIDYNMALAA